MLISRRKDASRSHSTSLLLRASSFFCDLIFKKQELGRKKYLVQCLTLLVCFLIIVALCWYIFVSGIVEATKLKLFNAYFESKATIIHSTVPLKKQDEYNITIWDQFGKLNVVDMTVFFQTSGRTSFLIKTLQSFFKFNTYPLKKIIAVHDGQLNGDLKKVIDQYPNITWIITNIKVGQLQAIDQAYKHIQTQYYFHSEDDWQYTRKGFIQYCLQALQIDPNLNHIQIYHGIDYSLPLFKIGPLQLITHFHSLYSGFSFWPSTHRMKQYRMLYGGYNFATFNLSYGKGVGSCQEMISKIFTIKGYHSAKSRVQFAIHAGMYNNSPIKYWQTSRDRESQNLQNSYQKWIKHHSNIQQYLQQYRKTILVGIENNMKN